ncbi:DUF3581 family protein [Thalassotalea mangrovi]|uniref:DUF3581 family protein n=1 Tax=Thalassotalea mangrovi TaxID=2572245 RepID=A0A4U1BAH9_9GAMM|nr:DUF3581 family protein [Thalassotalea mangrovi]TKB47696.1 DUF3581 family protein [Thalassotalea mangrovi]
MFIRQYYHDSNDKVRFSRQQASDFAKNIADDFNPLHDIDAKRFCVPGDLLFSVILDKCGIHQNMAFTFAGMVTDANELNFPEKITTSAEVNDEQGKTYLAVAADGEHSRCETLIESLVRSYVAFSGDTFPNILGELMRKKSVMINPARPMVMYESMKLNLNSVDVKQVSLQFNASETDLNVDGKRGKVRLVFDIIAAGKVIGYGEKHMVLSGLREYDADVMDAVYQDYLAMKRAYHGQQVVNG